MRTRVLRWLASAFSWLRPQEDARRTLAIVTERAVEMSRELEAHRQQQYDSHMERVAELVEARQMAGSGPWQVGPRTLADTDRLIAHAHESLTKPAQLRENFISTQGAFGDIELALQNVEWRREVNFSWLEFSRWGIQQIILISRLYYIKNPIIRRLIDVCSAYVFARGVEISSPDEIVNEAIDEFQAANPKVLGHRALCKLERAKDYDGNIFFVSFDDTTDKGTSTLRLIDPTEIAEIVTDPEDTDKPQYYQRVWAQKTFDTENGSFRTESKTAWYPAFDYDPADKPETIQDFPVMWKSPVYHSKAGDVAKWNFGCPRIYPALDWAKEARRYLEACASNAQSNAQIAREIVTKGGQQAIQGLKAQLQTTVGPSSSIWDQNPPAVSGATWAAGPGTKLDLVRQRGANQDPEEVRRYLLMCCMVVGVPETFLGDVSTGNLATATSLDRPTETIMLEKQEAWREDLMALTLHHLNISKNAASGKLREAIKERGLDPKNVTIRECRRVPSKDGTRMVYATLETKRGKDGTLRVIEAGREVPNTEIIVRVNFPAIREGDLKTLVDSTVEAMTLGNKSGMVIGIDEKAGVRKLYDLVGFDDGDELVEEQYPESKYVIDRSQIELPTVPEEKPVQPTEAQRVNVAFRRLVRAVKTWEGKQEVVGVNGHDEHVHT